MIWPDGRPHGQQFLGPLLSDVELRALPTQRPLRAARNELHPKGREILPPFDHETHDLSLSSSRFGIEA